MKRKIRLYQYKLEIKITTREEFENKKQDSEKMHDRGV